MENEVKMIFENAAQARYFMEWLSGCGEQDYFDAVAMTESEGAVVFDMDFDKQEVVGRS